MELAVETTVLEKSADFKSQSFAVKDFAKLFQILRSSMYSNPIKAICREIASNARDAHREVGKSDVPIEITLPNTLNPTYRIRDFGPGITPDRMMNVYLLYCESTKTKDNIQTGGFGLGAKTPFAYSDAFTIETITPEGNELIKRTYFAAVSKKIGEVNLVKEEVTQEPQGTCICVPVKALDFCDFSKYTEEVCRYWNPQPIVKGHQNFTMVRPTPDMVGHGWEVHNTGYRNFTAILDGIPYPVDANMFSNILGNCKVFQNGVVMYFHTGELNVTAPRESLDYSEDVVEGDDNNDPVSYSKTIRCISKVIEAIKREVQDSVRNQVELCDSLPMAIAKFNYLSNKYGVLEECSWRGMKFESGSARLETTISMYKLEGSKPSKPDSRNDLPFSLEKKFAYILNDTGSKATRSRLATLFDEQYQTVFVIEPWEDSTEYENNKLIITETAANKRERVWKALHLDHMGIKPLSLVPKKKFPRAPRGTGTTRKIRHYVRSRKWNQCWEVSSTQSLKDGSGVYLLTSGKNVIVNGKKLKAWELKNIHIALEDLTDVTLYGISSADAKKIGPNWVDFDTFIKKLITEKIGTSGLPEDTQYAACSMVNCHEVLYGIMDKLNKEGVAYKYLEASQKARSDVLDSINKIKIWGDYDVKDWPKVNFSLESMYKDFRKKYPMLKPLTDTEVSPEEALWYINKKDSE